MFVPTKSVYDSLTSSSSLKIEFKNWFVLSSVFLFQFKKKKKYIYIYIINIIDKKKF